MRGFMEDLIDMLETVLGVAFGKMAVFITEPVAGEAVVVVPKQKKICIPNEKT